MELYDQHLHSRHSFDSRAEPEDNVQRALELGLAGLTFTEHFDTHPDEADHCLYDDDAYSAELNMLRAKYGHDVFIGKGIEVCYQPQQMTRILGLLDRSPFDMVMLSVHWSFDVPIHLPSVWQDADPSAVLRRYLQAVLIAVQFCQKLHAQRGERVFDVLGHLDFGKRYAHRFAGCTPVAAHMDVIDHILRTCLEADVIPEINTSTIRGGVGEPMPGATTVRRYAELGGRLVSLGSDAHKPEHIAADFDQAATIARDAGLSHLAAFRNRRREEHPL